MKKQTKRIIAFLLATVMVLSGLPMDAMKTKAAEPTDFTVDFTSTDGVSNLNGTGLQVGTKGARWEVTDVVGDFTFNSSGYLLTSKMGNTLTLKITAPESGYYNFSITCNDTKGTRNANFYVNGVYVGDVCTTTGCESLELLAVYLNEGSENTVSFTTYLDSATVSPSGTSSNKQFRLKSFKFTAATEETVKRPTFEVNADKTSLSMGETATITAGSFVVDGIIFDESKANYSYSYTCDPEGVVTVDNGTVTAVASGNTTVTVKAIGSNGNVFGTDTIDFVVAGGTSTPTEAPTEEPGTGDGTLTLDFGMPTDGVVNKDGSIGAMQLTSTTDNLQLTKVLKGDGWTINTAKTTVPDDTADNTRYLNDNATGAQYHKTKTGGNKSTIFKNIAGHTPELIGLRLGHGYTIAFDFTAPSAGKYLLEVVYTLNTKPAATVTVNGGTAYEAKFESLIPKRDSTSNADAKTAAVEVTLVEGTNTIELFTEGGSSGAGFRAAIFTKVAGSETPTPAPTPTLAPTATPTPTEAPTEAPSTGDTLKFDFGAPTQGLKGDDVTSTGGMNVNGGSAAVTYTASTSLAGNGWSLNVDKTTIAKSDASTYNNSSGVYFHKGKGSNVSTNFDGSRIAIRLYCGQTMAFDIEVPTSGTYEMQVVHVQSKQSADVTVNPGSGYETTFTGLIPVSSAEGKTETVMVPLTQGTNTITFYGTGSSSYTAFRGVLLKRVGDLSEMPTPTPTPTPTLAPTATPMPTEDPNAVKEPFEVHISTLDKSTAYTENEKDYYFTKSTVGSNWAVHTSDQTVTSSSHSTNSTARIYTSAGTPYRVTLYKVNTDNVLSFTAPASGYYDLSAIMNYHAEGGYADIIVNDTYVGTVDSSKTTGVDDQKLLGVYLNGGELANKIVIRPTGASNGSGSKTYWSGFSFTTPETIATVAGMEIVTETNTMFVGDTQVITGNGVLTNDGLYRFTSLGYAVSYVSSDPTVATVSDGGVVNALTAGSTTITVSVPALGYTDTVVITVSDVAYDAAEINLTDNQAFTEGDTYTLEAKAKFNSGKYADADKVTVTYESDDETVAKVEEGVLYALTAGEATITAHVTYDGVTLDVSKNVVVEAYVPPTAFEVNFKGVKNTITSDDYPYISKDTYGTNWTVSPKTTMSLATSEENPGHARIFKDTNDYVTFYKKNVKFVYDVNVKTAGKYDITANMIRHDKGGYATIYVNDIYVGTVDTYAEVYDTSKMDKQPLLGVELTKGSNTITIHTIGPSGGTGYYTKMVGFSFTTPDEIATITAIDATADVDNMYIGRKEQINVEAILSNGGFYEYAYSDETFTYVSSNPSVATVSNKGLITGVAAGETTITVTANNTGLTDTIIFTVSDAAYEKVEMNVAEGEEFYVTNERPLEVVATLTDGTIISQNDLAITYTSSNPSVAKVENGVLKAVAKGNATITAEAKFTANNNNTVNTDIKNIVVTTIPLQGITAVTDKVVQELDKDGVQLVVQGIAEDGTIVEDLVVAGFTSLDFAYESLAPEILTIDANGVCYYVSRGVAQVKINAVIDGVPFEQVVDVVSSSGKTGRTLYTDEMVANAQYNVRNYEWGVKEVNSLSAKAMPYIQNWKYIYDIIPSEGIPRSFENSTRDVSNEIKFGCPACGVNVETTYGGAWGYDPLQFPWKIWCPQCKTLFPTNDFALLYERGLDENGQYNRELAYKNNAEAVARGEKDALVNEICPEKGATWMVDDGFGWSPSSGTYGTKDLYQYAPVARYMDYLWRYIMGALDVLKECYIYTGQDAVGIAGAVLLDRVADVYPEYDITKVGLNYYQSHGSGYSGKILGSIAEESTAEIFLRSYDAFYPMFEHPEVVSYLSVKAAEKGLENPKTNGNLVRENVENGVVRGVIDGLYSAKICGNFGYHQTTAAIAAVVLDTQPETDELLVWLRSPSVVGKASVVDPIFGKEYSIRTYNTGGEMATKYVNEIDRDGFGAEVSVSYNQVWIKGIKIAEILKNYGTDILDLYKDPKFVNMFESFIHMTAGDGYTLQLGDGGEPSSGKFDSQFCDDIISGYKVTRDPLLAQLFYLYCGGDFNNDKIGYFNNVDELSTAIKEDVAEHGQYELASINLTGYGLGIVRGGDLVDGYETRYDTWMYYGRTTGSHAHSDMLALGIDAYGFNFMPDLAAPAFKGASSERVEWISQTLSHNTVTVDEAGQLGVYTGTPLHFDVTDNVKVIDTESPKSYEQTDIYRRTAVTIAANDDVSYTLDFFRVKGGNQHTYSFHTSSYESFSTDDIELTPQINEMGEYVGTYAGIDVPYGPDPNSTDSQASAEPMYPRGYTWLDRVKRGVDKTGDGMFTVKFKQYDFKGQVADSRGLELKLHAINDWTADSVDIAVGHPGAKLENQSIPGYDYLLIQRKGENLDTLFTTLIEPYRVFDYILKAEPWTPTIKSGTEGADDIVKVVKVTLKDGRTDYVVYATNNDVSYNITDGNVNFDFAGFIGVYSVDSSGNNIYSYVNDGTIIGNVTSVGAYTGTVVDFTKELVLDDYIVIKLDQTIEDLSVLENQYIYVDNEGAKCNGAYRILSAKQQGENIELYLGNCSLIEQYVDDYDLDAGFVYTIADGQSFRIPVTVTEGDKFTGTNKPEDTSGDENIEDTVTNVTDKTKEDGITEDELRNDGFEDVEDTEAPKTTVEPTPSPTNKPATDNKGSAPTAEPVTGTEGNAPTVAGAKAVRNILLGSLGIAALGAGIFLTLLRKKKDEDVE